MSDTFPPTIRFGDADAEDEWDDIDAFRVRLTILERVLDELRVALANHDDRFEGRRSEAMRLVRKLLIERDEDTFRLERLRVALEELR